MIEREFYKIKFKFESFYKVILLIFLCMIYAFYEFRILFEMTFLFVFSIYFITRRKRLTIYVLWNLLFISICGLSILWSHNPQQSIIETRIMIEWAIVGNLIIAYVDRKERLIDLYKYFIIAGGALIIRLMITFPFTTWLEGRLGSDALGLNPNRVGLYLVISAICAMYLGKHKKKKIYYLIVLIFTMIVILTGSRKAFFMLIIGISGLFYLNAFDLSKKVKALFLAMIVLIVSYTLVMKVPTLYDIAGKRVEAIIDVFIGQKKGDYSSRVRMEMIETGKYLFKINPIIGYGIGSYSVLSGYGSYSHNNYIELLVGLGIVGTFIYYSIYAYVIIQLFKVRKRMHGNPLLIMVLTLLAIEYGLVSYNDPVYQILIATSFAASRVLKFNKKTKKMTSEMV